LVRKIFDRNQGGFLPFVIRMEFPANDGRKRAFGSLALGEVFDDLDNFSVDWDAQENPGVGRLAGLAGGLQLDIDVVVAGRSQTEGHDARRDA
jgi:hypothetical protein